MHPSIFDLATSHSKSPEVPLQTTLRLPFFARDVVDLNRSTDLLEISERLGKGARFILGGGSNLVVRSSPESPLPVTVIRNRLTGIVRLSSEQHEVRIRCAAGESWHSFVMWTLSQGLAGLENLALIPGTVGAAPIQNIGAYGVEVADRIDTVHAWDFEKQDHVTFSSKDCGFSYRWSRFKDADQQGPWDMPRFLITGVDFRLWQAGHAPVVAHYAGVRERVESMGHTVDDGDGLTAHRIAHAVMSLRREKLPDPDELPNAGSFFQNPEVPNAFAQSLKAKHPAAPVFASGTASKLSAGWLIDQCGLRGFRVGDAGVSERHALVLVNHGGANANDLLEVARTIQREVMGRFGVWLEPEPILVPPMQAY